MVNVWLQFDNIKAPEILIRSWLFLYLQLASSKPGQDLYAKARQVLLTRVIESPIGWPI